MNIMPDDQNLTALLERIKADELAKEQRIILSKESFEVWLVDTFTQIALGLGYTVQRIAEFFKTMGYAFKTGFNKGKNMAKNRGDLSRERIKRRFN